MQPRDQVFCAVAAIAHPSAATVTVPWRHVPYVLLEWARGLLRGVPDAGLRPEPALVRAFFRERYEADRLHDIVDARNDWYLAPLVGSSVLGPLLKRFEPLSVLDLGCGRGRLAEWLDRHRAGETTYCGIDQDVALIERLREKSIGCPRRLFLAGNVQSVTLQSLPPLVDAVFAINVFPYIYDPVPVLAAVRSIRGHAVGGDGTRLFVLDPLPSPFWETSFGGFGICVRNAGEWARLFECAGWRLLEVTTLAVASVGERSILPVAALYALGPSPSPANEKGHHGD